MICANWEMTRHQIGASCLICSFFTSRRVQPPHNSLLRVTTTARCRTMPPKAPKPPPPSEDLAGSLAAQQQAANSSGIAELRLAQNYPLKACQRLSKTPSILYVLIRLVPNNVKMQQDVMLALNRSSTLFISYLSKSAVDQLGRSTG